MNSRYTNHERGNTPAAHKVKCLTAAGIICVALLLAGCPKDTYHSLTRSAAGISDGLAQLQQSNEAAFRANLIDVPETVALAQGVSDATRANDVFVAALKQAKSVNGSNRSALLLDFGAVATSVEALNPAVLRIKNPDARAKFQIALGLVVTSTNAIIAILQSQQPAVVPANSWRTTNHGPNPNYFSDHDRRAARAEGDPGEARGEPGRRRAARSCRLGRQFDQGRGGELDRQGEGWPSFASNS